MLGIRLGSRTISLPLNLMLVLRQHARTKARNGCRLLMKIFLIESFKARQDGNQTTRRAWTLVNNSYDMAEGHIECFVLKKILDYFSCALLTLRNTFDFNKFCVGKLQHLFFRPDLILMLSTSFKTENLRTQVLTLSSVQVPNETPMGDLHELRKCFTLLLLSPLGLLEPSTGSGFAKRGGKDCLALLVGKCPEVAVREQWPGFYSSHGGQGCA